MTKLNIYLDGVFSAKYSIIPVKLLMDKKKSGGKIMARISSIIMRSFVEIELRMSV